MKLLFFALFLMDCALHLYACWPPEKHKLRRISKCLLMPLLACWYFFAAQAFSPLVFAGILCGFLGDAFLIVPEKSWTFICGLASFSAGHICYIGYMLGQLNMPPNLLLVILSSFVYLFGIACTMKSLWPTLPKLMFAPCLFYMLLISFMSLCALLFAIEQGTFTASLVFIGSLLFVVSDSILSYVTFRKRISYRYVIVMGTYILAQTMISASFACTGGF
ncbi:MAG: lysoplasmalogenase [Clostridia bacterium]